MKILEVYMECGGYDYQLIKGGISVYTWNLSNAFLEVNRTEKLAESVEQVAILTAMHGQQEYLKAQHGLVELDYCHQWTMRIDADPAIWHNEQPIELALTTKAYRLDKGEVSIYILSNHILDLYPDTYYPPYESKGKDIGFFKPLVFQAEVIHFIRDYFANQQWLIHAHEPYYQYLIPAAFTKDPSKKVISTVQSNMPINKKVYLPKVVSLCKQLAIEIEPALFTDNVPESKFNQCLQEYLPVTHLNYPYPKDYLNLFALCVQYSDKVDFLSKGHLEFYSQFSGTAYRPLFAQQKIGQLVQANKDKFFVGGCAISNSWLEQDFSLFEREKTLTDLGLDPALPTFFHNARYAPNHKGQVEIVLAVEQLLNAGHQANFILRCVSGSGIPDERFHQLARDYPNHVVLRWKMQSEQALMAMAAASDFALFPSKFEMDTFLIAIGEAMLAECVPIASEQLGMKHWWQCQRFSEGNPPTGFSVVRSFREDDPELVDSLLSSFYAALTLFEQPDSMREQAAYARQHALKFTWNNAAKLHLNAMMEVVGAESGPAHESEPSSSSVEIEETITKCLDLVQGELVSTRYNNPEAPSLPKLEIVADSLKYQRDDVVSVTGFVALPDSFERIELTKQEAGCFSTKSSLNLEQSEGVFLLVTLVGGDQYWDGISKTYPISKEVSYG